MVKNGLDQLVIANLVTVTHNHCSDLRVIDGAGQISHQIHENLKVLMRRMKHFDNVLITHQLPQLPQLQALCQRIDTDRFVTIADLDQAKLRVICFLPHEFSIHCQKGR